MGCCISKCKPTKKHSIDQEFNHHRHHDVQDKLVISQQAPRTPNILLSNRISPCPLSPPSSTSSISSFTCTTSNTSESCSSLSSSASSALSSKDRSFSNEFLWSCVKENPHIIRINSIKEASLSLATTKVQAQKLDSPIKSIAATVKQSIPPRINGSTPQKRVRSSSPTPLSRQKSFRREPERQNSPYILSSRGLRSPSPSRRFSGDSNRGFVTNTTKEICSNRMATKVHNANPVSSSLRKENFRPPSPSNNFNSAGLRLCLRNKETFTHRIGSKIDEVAVAEALASHGNSDPVPMEDIDNPLISLDCFIFL
ncbi:hypothetical protein CUMW_282820 [Citrus unshiu]|uniref:F24J8.12 protein n=3 Tax=Citrus TaxID=2706 RepID=A0ACB8KSI4_CITSI|nr:F24J8.12 protein [Citrus sinensis]GAY34903.1 hypothetical protein CUMW_282820 [Citrus unshiu]